MQAGHDKGRVISVRVPSTLRARLDTCASAIGSSPPELVRNAIRNECERIEKLHGQRERTARAVRGDGGGADGDPS